MYPHSFLGYQRLAGDQENLTSYDLRTVLKEKSFGLGLRFWACRVKHVPLKLQVVFLTFSQPCIYSTIGEIINGL